MTLRRRLRRAGTLARFLLARILGRKAAWPVETVPDRHVVYYRIHVTHFNSEKTDFKVGAFRDVGDGMSTDWCRYSTAEDARRRAKDPGKVSIVELNVGGIRTIVPLVVSHSPDMERRNRAHCDVRGDKKAPEVRVKLRRLARTAIPLS